MTLTEAQKKNPRRSFGDWSAESLAAFRTTDASPPRRQSSRSCAVRSVKRNETSNMTSIRIESARIINGAASGLEYGKLVRISAAPGAGRCPGGSCAADDTDPP